MRVAASCATSVEAPACCLQTRRQYARSGCSPSVVSAIQHAIVFLFPAGSTNFSIVTTLAAAGFSVRVCSVSATQRAIAQGDLPTNRVVVPLTSTKAEGHLLNGMKPQASELLSDKEKLLSWLRSVGLGHLTPRNVAVPGGGLWRKASPSALARLRYPLVVKTALLEGGSSGVRLVDNASHMASTISDLKTRATKSKRRHGLDESKWLIVQEAIPGRSETTIHFSARNGRLLAAFCIRYLYPRSRDIGGRNFPILWQDTSVKTLVPCDRQHLLPALRQIVRHTDYTGIGCLQAKTGNDPKKMPKIIELNARLCRGHSGTSQCLKGHACKPTFCGTMELFLALVGGCSGGPKRCEAFSQRSEETQGPG